MYLSYHLDISSGAAIVLVNFAVFVVVYAVTGSTGLRRLASLAHVSMAAPDRAPAVGSRISATTD